ncbi:MAG: LysM peptidoglycan-binding domain-containing protein [Chloroflexi bacterium]|nr:LysM peptidoglycan-binding domain-containing protein [Chloroflexota bacterium]
MKPRRILLTLLSAIALLALAIPPVGAAETRAPAHAFTYVVQLGDSLVTITRKFGVSATRIIEANNLRARPDLIFVGEKLIIPIDIGATPSYVSPFFYTVITGDTVQSLANKFYIDKTALRQANGLAANSNLLTAGTTILIPAGPHRYVVQRGDTIHTIAAQFNTTVNNLLKFNSHLGDGGLIFPGANVYVPIQYDATFSPILSEGTGGGGEGTATDAALPATGLKPTDSSDLARAANATVITSFQTITMPQNVVNLDGVFEYRWYQYRRARRDSSRDNGAIATIAITFRGGNGAYKVMRYDDNDGSLGLKGVNITGIYVNSGDKELWNDIEIEIPATCESVTHSYIYFTSGGKTHEAHLEFKVSCPP